MVIFGKDEGGGTFLLPIGPGVVSDAIDISLEKKFSGCLPVLDDEITDQVTAGK